MRIKKFLKKKLLRLQGSKNIFKLNYLYNKYFGEKDIGEIGLHFINKPNRQKIVQDTINRKNFKSYLEIGCFNDELYNFINCEHKIGVDPYSGGTTRKSSDDFFHENKNTFDCIFIDGLHIYKQVIKDILNSLKILNSNGVIFLHDCLPNNVYDQAVPRSQYNWNGTVWKAIVECRTIQDIDTYTIYADHGIGVILKRKNRKLLKIQNKNFSKLKFSNYYNNYKEYMNIISSEEFSDLF